MSIPTASGKPLPGWETLLGLFLGQDNSLRFFQEAQDRFFLGNPVRERIASDADHHCYAVARTNSQSKEPRFVLGVSETAGEPPEAQGVLPDLPGAAVPSLIRSLSVRPSFFGTAEFSVEGCETATFEALLPFFFHDARDLDEGFHAPVELAALCVKLNVHPADDKESQTPIFLPVANTACMGLLISRCASCEELEIDGFHAVKLALDLPAGSDRMVQLPAYLCPQHDTVLPKPGEIVETLIMLTAKSVWMKPASSLLN